MFKMPLLHSPQYPGARQYLKEKSIPINEGLKNLDIHKGEKILVKIGGECVINGRNDQIAKDLAYLTINGVKQTVAHGGGIQITTAMRRYGIEPIFVNGLRMVSDQKTLDVAVEGLLEVNFNLVNSINVYAGFGLAIGLTEEKVIYAKKHPSVINEKDGKEVDLGLVGIVTEIDTDIIDFYLGKGQIPILWCIGYGDNGQMYNINSDLVAEEVILEKDDYDIFETLTLIGGYMNKEGEIVPEMSLEEAEHHDATRGMKLKMDSKVRTLKKSSRIQTGRLNSPENYIYELLTDKGSGTIIRKPDRSNSLFN